MPGFGYSSEILLILIVALMVFGPKRLPEIGRSIGRAMNEFKRSMNEFKDQIETEVGTEKIKEELLRQQKEIQEKLTRIEKEPPPTPTSAAPPAEKIETEEDYARAGQPAAPAAPAPEKTQDAQ